MDSKRTSHYSQAVSVEEYVRFLLPDHGALFPGYPKWTADVFAVAGSLLARGGA